MLMLQTVLCDDAVWDINRIRHFFLKLQNKNQNQNIAITHDHLGVRCFSVYFYSSVYLGPQGEV